MTVMTEFTFNTLQLQSIEPHILQITLHRPNVMNAINSVMMRELEILWRELYGNHQGLRCLILTGSGNKAFCAGADLKERYQIDLQTWRHQHSALQQAMIAMMDCPLPVIAAVNGVAFGGGLELALASDLAYAANTATFAQSETRLGIMPGAMGTQNLPRACGLRRAKELCLTAKTFTAEEAYEWGIVNAVYPPEELMSHVIAVARQIAANAPLAVQQTKKALNFSHHMDIKSGYAYELASYNGLLDSLDRIEGIAAFNEKRSPIFLEK